MIIEGVITTQNADRTTNFAAMGPIVDESLDQFVLRPFQSSQTFANLEARREAVFHVTDDVELLVRSALNRIEVMPPTSPGRQVDVPVIQTACRWYELRVESIDAVQPRTEIHCEVLERGTLREFFGFCRAKHAVIEAAILASRVHLLTKSDVLDEFERLRTIVDKTASPQELRAFEFLQSFVRELP